MDYDKATTLAKNLRKFALFVQDNASELPDDIAIEVSSHLWRWDTTTDTEVPVAVGKAMRTFIFFRCFILSI